MWPIINATISIMATTPTRDPPGTSVSMIVTTRLFFEYGVAATTTGPGLQEW